MVGGDVSCFRVRGHPLCVPQIVAGKMMGFRVRGDPCVPQIVAGKMMGFRVRGDRRCVPQIVAGKMMDQGPVLVISFNAQQVIVVKNANGSVVEGDPVSSRGHHQVKPDTILRWTSFLHLKQDSPAFSVVWICESVGKLLHFVITQDLAR